MSILANDYRLPNANQHITPDDLRRALSDPIYYLSNYQQIVDKERRTVPFAPNLFQRTMFEQIVPRIARSTRLDRRHNMVIVKGRQVGASVSIVALINYICAYLDGINNLVVLHTFPVTGTIAKFYARKVAPIITGNHPDLFPTMERETIGSSIITTYHDIRGIRRNNIYELVSANAQSIRSDSCHIVVMDECSFYRKPYELEAAISPAIPDHGFSLVIYVSTFEDKNDFFKQKILTAQKNPEDWTLIFSPWYLSYPEKHDNIPIASLQLTEYDTNTILPALSSSTVPEQHYGDAIAWYHRRHTELGNRTMLMEYPTTIEEVLTYDDKTPVFNPISLDKQEPNILPPAPHRLSEDAVTRRPIAIATDESPLDIYKPPVLGEQYRIAIDPITSQSDDSDMFVMQVMNVRTHEQVAHFADRNLPDEEYVDWAYALAKLYNNALLVPEINVANGFVVGMNNRRYYNWYYHTSADRKRRVPGIRTTVASKDRMISALATLLDNNTIKIHCQRTLDELRTMTRFVKEREDGSRTVKMQAPKGKKDDECAALFVYAGSLDLNQLSGRNTSGYAFI